MKKTRSVLFALYCLALVYVLFIRGRGYYADVGNDSALFSPEHMMSVNLIPFKTIIGFFTPKYNGRIYWQLALRNVVGNFILFSPMGFFLPRLFDSMKVGRKYILTVLLIRVAVEILQFLTFSGSFDIDDILLNFAGALLSFALFRKVEKQTVPL